MGDKPLAGLVAAVAIAPVCAVCILGPAAVGSVIGSAFGWAADVNPFLAVGLATLGAAIGVAWAKKRRRAARGGPHVAGAAPLDPRSGASPMGPDRQERSGKAS